MVTKMQTLVLTATWSWWWEKKKPLRHGGSPSPGRHVDTQIKFCGKIVNHSNFWSCGSIHDLLGRNISTGKMKMGNNLYYRSWTWCEPRLLDCCGAFNTSLRLLSNFKWQRCLFISDESSKVILHNRTDCWPLAPVTNDLLETLAKEFKFWIKEALPTLLNCLDLLSLGVSFGTYWGKK